MSTPTIQLAFQGGGAKLAAMLPIAHAFASAQADRRIAIKAVSGSSAGALCAALVATRADFEAVRQYIIRQGPAHFSALVPHRLSRLMGQVQAGKLGFWQIWEHRKVLADVVLRGKPLLKDGELQSFVKGILEAGNDGQVPEFNEKIGLSVTVSDIVKSTGVSRNAGDMVDALVDSCSLPVLLRSFDSLASTHYVDGGLCDNLPVDVLTDRQHPVFAVFPHGPPEKSRIGNILTYFVSLLSASINHSVGRSIAQVNKPFQFPAETDLGLLDFDKAIENLADDDWYEVRMNAASNRIKDFSRSYGVVLAKGEARVVDTTDVEQYRDTLSILTAGRHHDFEYLKGQFVIRVNCDRNFANTAQAKGRIPDTITRLSRLRVVSDEARFYRAKVNLEEETVVPTIWSVRNVTKGKKEVPIRALVLTRDPNASVRDCLLEFVDPATDISRGDIIEIQSVYYSFKGSDMGNLNLGRADFFGFTNRHGCTIGAVELILVYPKQLGSIRLMLDTTRSAGLHTKPYELKLRGVGPIPIDFGSEVKGLGIRNLRDGAKFFVTVVP